MVVFDQHIAQHEGQADQRHPGDGHFWGFLGPGITDTPDGGRSHRRALIDGLIAAGHSIVFLQHNRDLDQAGYDLRDRYAWDSGLPAIDALFLEWRWPVPGRSTTSCGSPGHTCDLHRQDELVAHYTTDRKVPMIISDKDLKLEPGSPLWPLPVVAVCEAALKPSPGADSLLFPVADRRPRVHRLRPRHTPATTGNGDDRPPDRLEDPRRAQPGPHRSRPADPGSP